MGEKAHVISKDEKTPRSSVARYIELLFNYHGECGD